MNLDSLLKESTETLERSGFVHGAQEASIILTHIIGYDSAWLIANYEKPVDRSTVSAMRKAVNNRLRGQPLAYILGWQDFLGMRFKIDHRALIPRPETEQLVELIAKQIKNFGHTSGKFLEIGTGSGAVALSLKKMFPLAKITATDISAEALEIASENAKKHRLEVEFLQSDLFTDIPEQKFDVIVTNLPYVPRKKLAFVSKQILDWEPILSIEGGSDGLKYIKPFFNQAASYLEEWGLIALEMWHTHGNVVKKLSQRFFPNHETIIEKDLAGFERFALLLPLR